MLISEEQPAQPALPVQPEGTRVVCGHCGNTFLVCNKTSVRDINLFNVGHDHTDLTTACSLIVWSKCKLTKGLK